MHLEAFANIYRAFIADVLQVRAGQAPRGGYPTAQDGVRGLHFIAAALESAGAARSGWTSRVPRLALPVARSGV